MQFHGREQIEDYLTGRLREPRERERLERHVRTCASCREALREAERSRLYLQWLRPAEAPPMPGADFYARVQQSIEQQEASGWWGNLATAFRPRLAYPLAFLMLLVAVWTATLPASEVEQLTPVEAISTEFSNLSFPDADQSRNRDFVMSSLVEIAEAR